MNSPANSKWNLEERTFEFAVSVRAFVKTIPRNVLNREDAKQPLHAAGSVGASSNEAIEHLDTKDFRMRLKIVRKEAKEAMYWLRLLNPGAVEMVIARRNEVTGEGRSTTPNTVCDAQ